MLDISAIGRVYAPFIFKIESCKIKELCQAIGDDNPLFFDTAIAKKEGYQDTPAPLTFATVINFWGYPAIWDRMKEIGINVQKLLHASEEYQYKSPLYLGDVIEGQVMVESLRSSIGMDIAVFKSTYKRNNEVVLVGKMKVIVVTGEQ